MQEKDYFYQAEDVMKMLQISRSSAYKLIRQLNEEMQKQGFLTVSGRVSGAYFKKRFCCQGEEKDGRKGEE